MKVTSSNTKFKITNNSKPMKELTKAEEQVMQLLWDMKKAYVKDLVDRFTEPKPAYTTVSTIVRILEKKGFIGYKAYGKTHEYFPLIEKKDYTRKLSQGLLSDYFGNSVKHLVSFFSKEKKLSVSELEELRKMIDEEIGKQKSEAEE
jgi:BlaI family transcriptional regulator, penicillinase repressor